MTIINSKDFRKKCVLKINFTIKSDIQRVYNYIIYPRGSKLCSDEGFVNVDNGRQGRTHWKCFIMKDNKQFYFDSLGGQPEKILRNQLPKAIKYHKCKIQVIYSNLFGSYCLHFIYLFE